MLLVDDSIHVPDQMLGAQGSQLFQVERLHWGMYYECIRLQ